MHVFEYVVGPGVAIIHAGIERRHAGSGGWPHTGAYSVVQYAVAPTVTVMLDCAVFPSESDIKSFTVYVPARAYACVNVVDCTIDMLGEESRAAASATYHSSPQVTEYVSWPFSGSDAEILHVPTSSILSVVGPENPDTTGGRFPLPSKCAVQYGFCMLSGEHARSVHIAGCPGAEREQLLQPSFHALHVRSSSGLYEISRHAPSYAKVAPSACIMQRLEYVCGTGLHGVVMHTIGFIPHTGLYSFVHPTSFSPTRTVTVPSTEMGHVPRHIPPVRNS